MITKENFGKRISDLRIGGGKTQLVKRALRWARTRVILIESKMAKHCHRCRDFSASVSICRSHRVIFLMRIQKLRGKCGSYWRRLRCLHLNRGL